MAKGGRSSVVKGSGDRGVVSQAKKMPATTSNYNLRGGRGGK